MKKKAIQNLLDLISIEGPTGREKLVAEYLKEKINYRGL